MEHVFRPRGVCSHEMRGEIEDGIIRKVAVKGGCSGIRCGFKPTSCPDQLSKAIEECLEKTSN